MNKSKLQDCRIAELQDLEIRHSFLKSFLQFCNSAILQ